MSEMITRCPGISTGTPYLCGDGYQGATDDLDKVVQEEAEFLRDLFHADMDEAKSFLKTHCFGIPGVCSVRDEMEV